MKTVRMIYRQEHDGAWIGTCPEVPGYVAYGDTVEDAQAQANDGLAWFAEREDLAIAHIVSEQPELVEGSVTRGRRVRFALTASGGPRPAYGHRLKEATESPQS